MSGYVAERIVMARYAVCDDDIRCISDVERLLKKAEGESAVTDKFVSGEELFKAYSSGAAYDCVFLDMEMGGMNGIDTANKIRAADRNVIIIFITSHTKYMQKSFECEPFRYLLKPVDENEFFAVHKALCKRLSENRSGYISIGGKEITRFCYDDIVFIESKGHYIHVNTKDDTIKIRYPINKVIAQAKDGVFGMPHRSFLVNYTYVKSISSDHAGLFMRNEKIPVSRAYRKSFVNGLMKFEEGRFAI